MKMSSVVEADIDMSKTCPISNMKGNQDEKIIEDSLTNGLVDEKILRMMVKMGYKSGSGLGKCDQGIIAPINIPVQLGKRGLGLFLNQLDYSNEEWDSSLEKIDVKEDLQWLEFTGEEKLNSKTLNSWIVKGQLKLFVDDETNFVDTQLLRDILKAKEIFDELDLLELCRARSRANPFETIRNAFFMNRAALKMANIDTATNFIFTEIDRSPVHRKTNGPFYFADVCAGPGGFSEYILWRKKWLFKGFGFTLKGENDFKLHESTCMSGVTFQPYYGSNGDGNICNPDNMRDFAEKVLHQTDGIGVHFMTSDGGFSVEGNENLQEILSKQLYICQCLLALEIVRTNGYFVTKLFDIFTLFSVGLIFLMHHCFEKVALFKPNSSRPANSERYLICTDLKNTRQTVEIRKYLRKIVKELWDIKAKGDTELDITEIVPLSVLQSDAKFFKYIVSSNNKLGEKQKIGLLKLAAFCRNPNLVEPRQEILRSQCLSYWKIPDKLRVPQQKYTIDDLLCSAVYKPEFMYVQPREVNNIGALKAMLSDVNDWHFLPLSSTQNCSTCNFYAAVGGSKVYKLQKNKWFKVKNIRLCKGTLLYAEIVNEYCVSEQTSEEYERKSLHVVDALRLGDTSLADLPFVERLACIQSYCKAINFEGVSNNVRVRPKIIERFSSLPYSKCITCSGEGKCYSSDLEILGFNVRKEYYLVNSLLLLKTDDNQSFNSTYVLRVQVYLTDDSASNEKIGNSVSLDEIMTYLKTNC